MQFFVLMCTWLLKSWKNWNILHKMNKEKWKNCFQFFSKISNCGHKLMFNLYHFMLRLVWWYYWEKSWSALRFLISVPENPSIQILDSQSVIPKPMSANFGIARSFIDLKFVFQIVIPCKMTYLSNWRYTTFPSYLMGWPLLWPRWLLSRLFDFSNGDAVFWHEKMEKADIHSHPDVSLTFKNVNLEI